MVATKHTAGVYSTQAAAPSVVGPESITGEPAYPFGETATPGITTCSPEAPSPGGPVCL